MVALVAVATPDRVSSGRGAAVEDKRIRFDGVLRGDLGFVGLLEPPAGDDFPFDEFLTVSRQIETLPPSRCLPPRQFDIRNHTAYYRVDFLPLPFGDRANRGQGLTPRSSLEHGPLAGKAVTAGAVDRAMLIIGALMPTVLRWRGYKFLFFSLDEGEPPHVHVGKGRGQAKFWLSGCRLAKAKGFAEHELRQIARKIDEEKEELLRAWHDHFGT